MRYLYIKEISEASHFLSQLENETPNLSFVLETFSCKSTKKQKKEIIMDDKINSYLIATLNLSYNDYKFINANFKFYSVDECKKETLGFFNVINHKIASDANDLIFKVIDKTLNLKAGECYFFENREGPFENAVRFFCYLFYGKKKKRIVLFAGKMQNDLY
ncbi:hypothetical protein BDAP_000856 [Binucleata daphniae]